MLAAGAAGAGAVLAVEQTRLARAGLSGRATLVVFRSENCSLCQSLEPLLGRIQREEDSWLELVRACVDNDAAWAPEMLRYDVSSLPCAVLISCDGAGACRTGTLTARALTAAACRRRHSQDWAAHDTCQRGGRRTATRCDAGGGVRAVIIPAANCYVTVTSGRLAVSQARH